MPIFVVYEPPIALPAIGATIENATLDFKAKPDLGKTFHLAKDVAAFANHLGGCLVFGAAEQNCVVTAYPALTGDEAGAAQDAISKAVSQRCSPRPIFKFARYNLDSARIVLSVAVWPSIGQPVGVRVDADSQKGGYGGPAYVFPVRSGSDSVLLLPEQLHMYMVPHFRRVAIELADIVADTQIVLHAGFEPGKIPSVVRLRSSNTGSLTLWLQWPEMAAEATVPFEGVKAVWRCGRNHHIALTGWIRMDRVEPWQPG